MRLGTIAIAFALLFAPISAHAHNGPDGIPYPLYVWGAVGHHGARITHRRPRLARHAYKHHYAQHEERQNRDTSISVPKSLLGRPRDCYGIPWCGCWLRHVKGIADKAYNLAANWAHWGHATSAHIGAVVVFPHHVGLITGGSPGDWIVTSGNDGHAVRTRRRSLAGAIAFRD